MDSISVALLNPGPDSPDVEEIFNDPESMRPLITRFDDPTRLRVCCRLVRPATTSPAICAAWGVLRGHCHRAVDDPEGDKVKTDTRDCRLARLHGAGELVAVRVLLLGFTLRVSEATSMALRPSGDRRLRIGDSPASRAEPPTNDKCPGRH
jgi:hypothetical protein